MSYNLDIAQRPSGARIKVIGVGGAGGNAINTMIQSNLEGVEFIAANTDLQALETNLAGTKLQLGGALTRGLGAGADPSVGHQAALESQADIARAVADCEMVFVTTGLGGGTGTGAAPVVARQAREAGALTVAVVSKPFRFEGRRRMRLALEGMEAIRKEVDTIIVVPNDRLMAIAGEDMTAIEAFRCADRILYNAVKGVSDLISQGGFVNTDFADVKAIMSNSGMALMGTGEASGPDRALEAATLAISSPLLEDAEISGATGILINVVGGPDVKMTELNAAASFVEEAAHEDANIIFGTVIDESMGDMIRVTVIATGFPDLNVEIQKNAANATVVTDNFMAKGRAAAPQVGYRAPQPAQVAPAATASAARSEMTGGHAVASAAPERVASSIISVGPSSMRSGSDYDE